MFLKTYDLLVEFPNKLPNGLFGTNAYNILESC